MKICPKCGENHLKNGVFCSRICANSRNWSDDDRKKKSKAAKKSKKVMHANKSRIVALEERSCLICSSTFSCYPKHDKKLCSKHCADIFNSKFPSAKMGGLREGSGRAKTGRYKGMYYGSTYELVWGLYNQAHDIGYDRCYEVFLYNDGKNRYHPDFVLENGTIVEIKGFWSEDVDRKAKAVRDTGRSYVILYKEDLKSCFMWFSKTYPGLKPQDLYE